MGIIINSVFSICSQKKGADRGIDGRLYFHDNTKGDSKQILFFVKAGGMDVARNVVT